MGKFYLRDLKLDKAEQYIKDAFSFSIKNNTYAFIYATFLVSVGRSKEAAVILEKLAADHFEEVKVNSLLAIAYDMDLDTVMKDKYIAMAQTVKLRELNKMAQKGEGINIKPKANIPHRLPPSQ